MSRLVIVLSSSLLLSGLGDAKPDKTKPPVAAPTAISVANATRVRPIKVIAQDIWKIVRLPERGELAFVYWQKQVHVVRDGDFQSTKLIADGQKVAHFATSKTGNLMAWSQNSTRVTLTNETSGTSLEIETAQPQSRVAFSPDGKTLATGGYGTQAKLWDTEGRALRTFDAGREGGLTPVFSPDGKLLAIGNRNDETRIYEVLTGKLTHTLPRSMTQELAFSPDGKTLAAGYVDGSLALWDVARGEMLHSKATGGAEVYTVDWSPAGDVLASAGLKGKIVLWDPRNLTVLKELDCPEWVIQVRFTQDGSRLLSAGGSTFAKVGDRKLVVWALSNDSK